MFQGQNSQPDLRDGWAALENREQDRFLVDKLLSFEGNKVVCGGTTSKIVSKVSGRALTTQLDYITPEIPPWQR